MKLARKSGETMAKNLYKEEKYRQALEQWLSENPGKTVNDIKQSTVVTLNFYAITKEEKVDELIHFIKENHRLPRQKTNNNGKSEALYKDNTDMNRFFSSLLRSYKRSIEYLEQGKRLTKKQQQDITYYKKVRVVLDYYKENNEIVVSNIVEYLENLRKNNAYEEIVLLYDVIIENKNLTDEEQENLKNAFKRYLMHVKIEDNETVKIKRKDKSNIKID